MTSSITTNESIATKDLNVNLINSWLETSLKLAEQPASSSTDHHNIVERWNSLEQWAGWVPLNYNLRQDPHPHNS